MNENANTFYTAFAGNRRIASGDLAHVAARVKEAVDADPQAGAQIFDDATGEAIEIDLRGTLDEVLKRLGERTAQEAAPAVQDAPRGPGRPRLGVVAREVTLLPRHWEWLQAQPGGASVALRKLVEDARRSGGGKERARQAQQAAYRFMSVMAGDRPAFEEAMRALFAGDRERFTQLVAGWPDDIRDHAAKLAEGAFGDGKDGKGG